MRCTTHDLRHAARRLVSYAAVVALVGAVAAPATFAANAARQRQAAAPRQQQAQQPQHEAASDRQQGTSAGHGDDLSQLQGKWERGKY